MMEVTKVRNIETITGEIKALQQKTLACAVEIGRRLHEAKELLPHGEWGEWLKNKADFSQSTANNLMRLFDEFGSSESSLLLTESNSQTFANISYSNALRLLSLPENEREDFVKENDVENLSAREMDRLVKERKDALDAKAAAEKRAEDAERERANALTVMQENTAEHNKKLEEANHRVKELSDSLAELKSKPIEVAVTKADPAEMEAAVEKAKADAETERKKEIAEIEKKLKAAEKDKTAAQDAKAEAENEKQKLLEEIEAEKKNTAALGQQLETLRKAQAMSDPVVTEFKTIFNEVQRMLKQLKDIIQDTTDNDNKTIFETALNSMLEAQKVCGEAAQ